MLRTCDLLPGLLVSGLIPDSIPRRSPFLADEGGNPWWIWLAVLLALAVFIGAVLWWWMRPQIEEEGGSTVAAFAPGASPSRAAVVDPVFTAQATVAEADEATAALDDLKRIEGIGPRISSVLRAAGIGTFDRLANTEVDRLRQILGNADPRLLQLADPSTWPEQARMAASGQWDALALLQEKLKGGRRL